MNKLVFLSKESVFGGHIQTAIAELVDCLGVSLNETYQVNIVCYGCQGSIAEKFNILRKKEMTQKIRFVKMNYYFVEPGKWDDAFGIVEKIKPDILHIFTEPDDINKLITRPSRVLFTFSDERKLINQQESLNKYDAISATSRLVLEKAKMIDGVAQILEQKNAVNIDNALLTEAFSPEKGILIAKPYSPADLSGKEVCKQKLQKSYGIPEEAPIFVTGALRRGGSIKKIIDLIPVIKSVGGFLIIATRTTPEEEILLRKFKHEDRVVYLGSTINYVKLPTLLAGSDFYIQPDDITLSAFSAMAASRYGTIPIVDLNNPDLADKFDESNAIIVYDGDYETAIYSAVAAPMRMRRGPDRKITGMTTTCEWKNQKQLYIDLYNK